MDLFIHRLELQGKLNSKRSNVSVCIKQTEDFAFVLHLSRRVGEYMTVKVKDQAKSRWITIFKTDKQDHYESVLRGYTITVKEAVCSNNAGSIETVEP